MLPSEVTCSSLLKIPICWNCYLILSVGTSKLFFSTCQKMEAQHPALLQTCRVPPCKSRWNLHNLDDIYRTWLTTIAGLFLRIRYHVGSSGWWIPMAIQAGAEWRDFFEMLELISIFVLSISLERVKFYFKVVINKLRSSWSKEERFFWFKSLTRVSIP